MGRITHKTELMTIKVDIRVMAEEGYDNWHEYDVTVTPRGAADDKPCYCTAPMPEISNPNDYINSLWNQSAQYSSILCNACWIDEEISCIGLVGLLTNAGLTKEELEPLYPTTLIVKGNMVTERFDSHDWGTEYDSYFEIVEGPIYEEFKQE